MRTILIIHGAGGIVVKIEGYVGPIPRAGEYISCPGPVDPVSPGASAMKVKTVTCEVLARPRWRPRFAGRPVKTIEVWCEH